MRIKLNLKEVDFAVRDNDIIEVEVPIKEYDDSTYWDNAFFSVDPIMLYPIPPEEPYEAYIIGLAKEVRSEGDYVIMSLSKERMEV